MQDCVWTIFDWLWIVLILVPALELILSLSSCCFACSELNTYLLPIFFFLSPDRLSWEFPRHHYSFVPDWIITSPFPTLCVSTAFVLLFLPAHVNHSVLLFFNLESRVSNCVSVSSDPLHIIIIIITIIILFRRKMVGDNAQEVGMGLDGAPTPYHRHLSFSWNWPRFA